MKKSLRKAIGILLAVAMTVSLMPGFTLSVSAEGPGLSGEGTQVSPYIISNRDEFIVFRDYVNSGNTCENMYFKMTNSVDLEGSDKNQHTPIGSPDLPFKGHFDGAGHGVLGIYISQKAANDKGLFGCIGEGGSVKNLTVRGYIQADKYIGGIAGSSYGTIENCTNYCSLYSYTAYLSKRPGGYVGGITGYSTSDIINCANFGTVDGNNDSSDGYFGGIAGQSNGGNILNCYNTAMVRSGYMMIVRGYFHKIAGIAGYKYNGIIKNCYNTGSVAGSCRPDDGQPAGITSYFDENSRVETCYNTGTIVLQDYLVGYGESKNVANGPNISKETVINCFYLDKRPRDPFATPLQLADFLKPETLNALNQNNVNSEWGKSPLLDTPLLVNNPETFYGSGTEDDPYIIKNARSLAAFRDYVNSGNDCSGTYARLDANIDISLLCGERVYDGNSSSPKEVLWTPIGSDNTPYNGHFDGNGYTISNIYKSSTSDQGLFGTVGSNTVIEGLSVNGTTWCNGTINGGIAAKCSGKITNCYTNVFFSSDSSRESGGIAGILKSGGVITNCYSVGKPQMVNGSGGLVGEMESGSELSDSYFYNTVIGTGIYFGRIAYIRAASAVINNCYWLEDSTHYRIPGHGVIQGDESGIQSLKKDDFKNLADALNSSVWSDSALGRPQLRENTESMFLGAGTEDDPYIISSAALFERFRKHIEEIGGGMGEHFKITADIDLSSTYGEGKLSWIPISTAFDGTLDGNGHTISGFYINDQVTTDPYKGLFSHIGESGAVKNLTLTGSINCRGDYIGGIAGECLGSITDCRSGVNITAAGSYVGGIVGKYGSKPLSGCSVFSKDGITVSGDHVGGIAGTTDAAVTNCEVSVPVSGVTYVGGIIGDSEISAIANCGVSADVSGGTNVGGIAGLSMGGTISNSYLSTGVNVSGDANVGGIVGNAADRPLSIRREVHISNCYTAGGGTISSAKGDNTGGIAGTLKNYLSTIENCTNNNDVIGKNYTGGIAGITQDEATLSVTGCRNSGDISGDTYVGGITGCNSATLISLCSNSGNINGNDYTGGITGYHKYMGLFENVVSESYNTGAVMGLKDVGGVIGLATGRTNNLYNAGNVGGSNYVGGIIGELRDDNSSVSPTIKKTANISHAYNYGNVSASGNMFGATIGLIRCSSYGLEAASYSDLYYLEGSSANNKGSGSPIITQILISPASADDFASTLANKIGGPWKTNHILGRPTLINNPETALSGEGTPEVPFDIPDLETLESVRDYVNEGGGRGAYFTLTNDIDLSEKYGEGKQAWTPIGNDRSHSFRGIFDGGGHTISGLYASGGEYTGLFGDVQGGMVKDLAVSGSVSGSSATGGIVASLEGGTVENCLNYCTVSGGTGIKTGGIVGSFETNLDTLASSVIKSCLNMGGVSANDMSGLGAVAGGSGTEDSRIINCFYLEGSAPRGVGFGGMGTPEAKTADELKTGAVAHMLQNGAAAPIWGQTIGEDDHPILSDMITKKVLKVTFVADNNKEYAVKYVNYGRTVTPPAAPTNDGYIFNMWAINSDQYKFTASTPITDDLTVYAVGRAPYGGEAKEITLNAVYGDGITEDLSKHMSYKNGNSAKNKFIYTISSDNSMGAEIEGDMLIVPADTANGNYALTINAVEKTPNFSLMSVEDYGTQAVTLNVRITIAPRASSVTAGAAKTAVYGGTLYLAAQVSRASSGVSLAAEQDKIDFYVGNTLLGTADVKYANGLKDNGYAIFETKADKRLKIGENQITASYGGSINLAGSGSNTVTVTMTQKPLDYATFAASKVFDGTPDTNVMLTPSNTGGDDVTMTAKGAFASAETGDYSSVNLSEITIGGADAGYYTAETAKENAPLAAAAHIVPASGETSVTMPDYLCGGAAAAEPIAVSDTNGTDNVTYSYKAKDADDSTYVPYKPDTAGEYTVKAVFAATLNYSEDTAYDDFTVSHSFGEWSITNEPTMTEGGSAERYCIGGDMTDAREIPNLSDASVWSVENRAEPTYSSEGSLEYVSEYGTVIQTIPALTASGIRIKTPPTKTDIVEGMPLDISGLAVENVYPDGTAAETNDYQVSGYDASRLGEQTIEVTQGEFKAEFNINVIAKSLIGIEITTPPDKTLYYMGESLDTSGMEIAAKYNNYTSEPVTDYDVYGYDINSGGEQTITVSYNGQTAQFIVTVKEPEAPAGTVEKPLIQAASYYGGKTVYITCADSGAEIYYTTDGAEPSASSERYREPIKLTSSAQIKAIAIKQGMIDSEVSSEGVTVAEVETIETNVSPGEVEAGTLLTLKTSTSGAEIYYSTDGTLTSDNYKKYSGGIIISGEMTIRAIAVKKGWANSEVLEAAYTVKNAAPAPTLSPAMPPDRVLLYPGYATSRAGGTVDLPIYAYGENTITDYRMTVDYDSGAFEYESVTPPKGAAASSVSVSASDGKITVRYSGGNIMSDELCQISLRAKETAPKGEYGITVSDAAIKTKSCDSADITVWDGYIDLSSADTKVIADVLLTDSEQNVLHDPGAISGDITAYIFIEDVYDVPTDGSEMNAAFILAFYDAEGALVASDITGADLANGDDAIIKEISVPQNAEIESVKLMIWDGADTMKPLADPVTVF